MPRKEPKFNCQPLADLHRQLLYAPPPRRAEQVRRIEALHDMLNPDQTYPLDFFVYRITGYHKEERDDTLLIGAAAAPDLRQMIDLLSKSIEMPVSRSDPAETPDELAARLNVSVKTLTRWRKLGLRWRWAVPEGESRHRVVYPRDAVDRFLKQQADRVNRAAGFTQMPDAARDDLLRRARRIAESADVSLNRVATHLSNRSGRALETIRQLLINHDRRNPDDPIFADRTGPLSGEQRRAIYDAFKLGARVRDLSRQYRRTRSSIYRTVREQRAAELRARLPHFITSPTFQRDDADEVILRPESSPDLPDDMVVDTADVSPADAAKADDAPQPLGQAARQLDDLPPAVRPLYDAPTLPPTRQLPMFVRMHYLRFKAARLLEQLNPYEPQSGRLDRVEEYLNEAQRVHQRLVEANLPVVLSVARQQLVSDEDRSQGRLLELLESGNQTMLETLDQFDPFQGQTFFRHLVWTLTRHFAREGAEADPPQEPADEGRLKAHKKPRGRTILTRMRAAARRFGVDLQGDDGPE